MMLPTQPHSSLYAAFDRYPSAKGASTHISHFAKGLFDWMPGGLLYVLGDEELPGYQKEDSVEIIRFSQNIPNFLKRTVVYGQQLSQLLALQQATLKVCHFRDPWSGVPILGLAQRSYATVYEVNGLPSIELPYLYPGIGPRTLAKIRDLETFCLKEVDQVIVPSHVIKRHVTQRGIDSQKIRVIPNGAEIDEVSARPVNAPSQYLIYFGALQRWQGVDILLKAFARLRDISDLELVLCVAGKPSHAKPYIKLAEKLEIQNRLQWHYNLNKAELRAWIGNAMVSVAPLIECSRNLDQGCCPLKILESMAAGVPVVASDLPVVREIMEDGQHGCLVRPNRPTALAQALRLLWEYPQQRQIMGQNAHTQVANCFRWDQMVSQLQQVYSALPR